MKKKIVSCLLVAVMCTLIGSVAYADESGSMYRAENIKSHGTLLCEQADSDDEVYITSQDLIYLANDIDRLSDLIDGLQCKDNPNIEYIYHYHAGSSSSGGGCYTVPVYHSHSGSCPSHQVETGEKRPCGCTSSGWTTGDAGYGDYKCGNCGHEPHGGSCNHSVNATRTEWDCGMDGKVEYYNLGCGWTQGAIESAHIEFEAH